jgi:hypothetical protein
VTAAVGGVILATYLRLQYSHIVKYCLKEIKEGIRCCKFSNDWHREGDEFDSGQNDSHHRGEPLALVKFGDDGRNSARILSDRVSFECRNSIRLIPT